MFTVEQIRLAHSKVNSGADFPAYIQDIKKLGVRAFETWVKDSHTVYFGANNFQISSDAIYDVLSIGDKSNPKQFEQYLRIHQKGDTDYLAFCNHCAETGIEKWLVSLEEMTCTYYDKEGKLILTETIPE